MRGDDLDDVASHYDMDKDELVVTLWGRGAWDMYTNPPQSGSCCGRSWERGCRHHPVVRRHELPRCVPFGLLGREGLLQARARVEGGGEAGAPGGLVAAAGEAREHDAADDGETTGGG